MADFLSNLIARTLNQGRVLERRRPALFEPGRNLGQADWSPGQPLEEVVEEEAKPVKARKRALKSSRGREPESPLLAEFEPRLTEPGKRVVRPRAVQPPPPALDHTVKRETPPPRLTESAKAPERSPAEREVRIESKTETVREIVRAERTESLMKEERVMQPRYIQRVVRPEWKVDETAAPPPALVRPSRPARTIAVARTPERPKMEHVLPRAVKRARVRAPGPPLPPPPSVTVSIGRVEIRVPERSVPAPRTARPAALKLGLDEYLRRRDGGTT